MINATSYTPLESLFLFTWIRSHGLDAFEAQAFPRLSQDLINNDTIKEDPTYDASRLTPESLQELFLHLLQEELKDDPAAHDAVPVDGSLSPNSRKRKRPGSTLQLTSLQDARQHVHRLPDAEAKLYAKYKQRAAQQLWQEQEELARLEEEIKQLELKERQVAEARNGTSTGPSRPSVASPVKENDRPPSATQNGGLQKPSPKLNGTGARPAPPAPAQNVPPKSVLPPRQASPARPLAAPIPSQPLVQPLVGSSGQFAPIRAAEPPKSQHPSAPVPQPPHTVPVPAPAGPSVSPAPPTSELPQKPAGASKPGTPSNASQSPQLPVPGALKWEPPYQPYPGSQQQKPPQNIAHNPAQKSPHLPQQWGPQPQPQPHPQSHPQPHPQPQLQHSNSPPLQHPSQGHIPQQGSPHARPILVAPQPGGQPPPSHPTPVRSHSGSPAPAMQRPAAGPSPLPVQARLPQSPYQQHNQPVFPPSQHLPINRIAPNVAPTPQPPPQQWQKPPNQIHVAPSGVPQVQQAQPAQPAQQLQPAQPAQAAQPAKQAQQAGFSKPPLSVMPQVSSYNSPYSQAHCPAVSAQAAPQQVSTPGPGSRRPHPVLPHTPITMPFTFRGSQGSGTKWKSVQPTPSTPGPAVGHVQSPAFEPLSPVMQTASIPAVQPKRQPKPAEIDTSAAKNTPPQARSTQAGGSSSRRHTSSVPSPREDPEQVDADSVTKIKREEATPKPLEDAGDTTADESVSERRRFASPRNPRPIGKRKRQDSAMSDNRTASEVLPRLPQLLPPPPPPPGIPTHVLWTRGFPKVSASTLEQISSHKYANMFTNPIKPKEAPGYHSIVLRATCLKTIQKAIHAGNKAAAAAAAALPDGDPGTSSVWLPIGEELVPPRAIINSAQLERELVHMFANAIMYNLDPNRGPGPSFLIGSGVGSKGANEAHGRNQSNTGGDAANMIGYQVDQDSVVKDTQSMFSEVDKLLIELRSTEAQPGVPPALLPPGAVPASERLARASFAAASVTDQRLTPPAVGGSLAEGDAEEHHTDREEGASGTVKRRRLGRSQN